MNFADVINEHWESAWWLWFWTAFLICFRGSTKIITIKKSILD